MGTQATDNAAIVWAKRPPPISRAKMPASQTKAAPAIAGNRRKPNRESPNACRAIHAIRAINGGWST